MATSPPVPAPNNETQIRWTWITILLVLYHLFFLLLASRHSGQLAQQPRHPVLGFTVVLFFQWIGFYIAWRGIRASNLSFGDLFRKQGSSRWLAWRDIQDAIAILFIALGVNLALARFQSFAHSNALHSKTLAQFGLVLLVAVSAGFTEEVTYRGFYLSQLRVLIHDQRLAIVLQAVIFAVFHGFQQNLTLALSRLFYGILFAFFVVNRNSLWPAIVGHVIIDVLAVTFQHFKYH
jgi:membrane protease YdiL (CAAX protease family)